MIYGRRQGRRLTPVQRELVHTLLPSLEIKIEKEHLNISLNPSQQINLEIGFGAGEHLVLQASLDPQALFIGCEPFINGVSNLLTKIKAQSIKNICIFKDDARLLLEVLPNSRLSQVFILFPDPWPKKRHHKRRFINAKNLEILAQKMKQDASLLLATDHLNYREWIKEHLELSPFFEIVEEGEKEPLLWTLTRFQEKGLKEGRVGYFIKAKKKG